MTYRGYYFDRDLRLYYLNARYYDFITGRFISPDDLSYLGANGDILSYNLYAYCSNNPIMFTDPSGNEAISVCITTATVVLIALLCVAVAKAAVDSSITDDNSRIDGKIAGDSVPKSNDLNIYSVYILVDPNDNGKPKYVGRTRNTNARETAHKANPFRSHLDFEVVADGLSYEQARGLEQKLIDELYTLNKGNKEYNQINGISRSNPNFLLYMSTVIKLIENRTTNEILNWLRR